MPHAMQCNGNHWGGGRGGGVRMDYLLRQLDDMETKKKGKAFPLTPRRQALPFAIAIVRTAPESSDGEDGVDPACRSGQRRLARRIPHTHTHTHTHRRYRRICYTVTAHMLCIGYLVPNMQGHRSDSSTRKPMGVFGPFSGALLCLSLSLEVGR
ncbi:hypothetical protein F5X96DRAFT_625705 [Biscogniauxia mediterranea]|nr:hypothetical protein F5X96DRAFT_625705 [Biscogniauxia mediterranea]